MTKTDEPIWPILGQLPIWVIALFCLVVVVLFISLLSLGPPAPESVAQPVYASAADCFDIISAQERAGQWEVAATNARTCLARPNLNPADAAILVNKALADGLQAFNAKQIATDNYAAQIQALEQFEELKVFAEERKVTLPKTFYQIAQESVNSGRLLMARVAFQDAFEHADVSSSNFAHVRFIHDTTYNLAWGLTRNKANPGYNHGLSLLVAANLIDGEHRLGIGLALLELNNLEPDQARWPAPAKTAMLKNNSNGKEE